MIRVLTLSTLFPDASRPRFGPFVERQTLGLAAHPDVELKVVAPIGVPPWPLSQARHYAGFAAVPEREEWRGLDVLRPRFLHVPGTGGRFDAGAIVRRLTPILKDLRHTFAFDVIDAQFFFPDGLAGVRLGEALGVPVSVKARGSDIHFWGERPASRPQVIEAGAKAQGMLAVSEALKADMVAMGMPAERIRVHRTGVDLDLFKPVARDVAKAALGVSGPLLASVGALIERKGHALVIEALATLPGVTLAVIGQGADRGRLEELASRLGVADRVRFTGSIDHEAMATWLGAADAMVLASASEGLANVWVEALACGTPIVITDVGGARELLDRPEAGRLVAPDSGEIAKAVTALLADPPDPQAVRRTAERFTWEANTAALYDHLKSLI